MSPKSILLIDDDVGLLRRLSAAFALKGFQVHAATDGQCGLERMVQVSPDVVVTDILMPTREGLETIMAMRQAAPGVRIVAMTGGGRTGPATFLELARLLGADRAVAKPFRFEDLHRLVDQLLRLPSAAAL